MEYKELWMKVCEKNQSPSFSYLWTLLAAKNTTALNQQNKVLNLEKQAEVAGDNFRLISKILSNHDERYILLANAIERPESVDQEAVRNEFDGLPLTEQNALINEVKTQMEKKWV